MTFFSHAHSRSLLGQQLFAHSNALNEHFTLFQQSIRHQFHRFTRKITKLASLCQGILQQGLSVSASASHREEEVATRLNQVEEQIEQVEKLMQDFRQMQYKEFEQLRVEENILTQEVV